MGSIGFIWNKGALYSAIWCIILYDTWGIWTDRDRGNSDYGTAIVATIDSANNTISYGSPTVFNSANSLYISPTFDSSNNKVVIFYRDEGDSNHGKTVVATVSGTSISYGSVVAFEASEAVNKLTATFDSSNNKILIAYNSRSKVGTVSGTSISFGTHAEFEKIKRQESVYFQYPFFDSFR